ncbi:hypothetical protein PIB30_007684 [Stylosanthes scabra]|uniref:LOB domain-containing protein n=1 Tax=Stylosanthes scabra TaxID=79078 RepID=A0ABU6W5D9_9FABA|nr:hypothetical protein [Stylosanthes scabra]
MDIHGEVAKAARRHQPCAACRMLRRRCDSKCLLAPFFPPEDVHKFLGVHRVFGASNVIKMIQVVEETKREDAVKAMVYEAKARLRDPVYGSTGAILQLQKMIEELKQQLESIRSRVFELQQQKEHYLFMMVHNNHNNNTNTTYDENNSNDPIFQGYYRTLSSSDLMAYDEFPVQ